MPVAFIKSEVSLPIVVNVGFFIVINRLLSFGFFFGFGFSITGSGSGSTFSTTGSFVSSLPNNSSRILSLVAFADTFGFTSSTSGSVPFNSIGFISSNSGSPSL